jgi:hypothetical protein
MTQYVTATSTYRPRTKRELEEEIIMETCELYRRKWWQNKSNIKQNIKRAAEELNSITL